MSPASVLAELVIARPAAARVFHRHGLDFYCGGKQTLEDACEKVGLNPQILLSEIDRERDDERDNIRWDERSVEELVDHIINRYHVPLRKEIPRLIDLARQVELAHADQPGHPRGLSNNLASMHQAVESHLPKEEKILFPLARSGRGQGAYMPIQIMMQEHKDQARNLRRTRELTDNLKIPEHACAGWRKLYSGLERLEADLMNHIHLENNILFLRVLAR